MTNILDHHELCVGGMPAILDALKKLEAELTTLGCRVEIHVTISAPRAVVADWGHGWNVIAEPAGRPVVALADQADGAATWDAEEANARCPF